MNSLNPPISSSQKMLLSPAQSWARVRFVQFKQSNRESVKSASCEKRIEAGKKQPLPAEHLNHEQIPSSLFSKPGKTFQDKSKQSMGLVPWSKSRTHEDDLEDIEDSLYPVGSAQVDLPQLPRLAEWKS